MPNQYTQPKNPLAQLVEFETHVQDTPIGGKVRATLQLETLTLTHRGVDYVAIIDRPIIHQLGSRIWAHADWELINKSWVNLAFSDPQELCQLIEGVFHERQFTLRYFKHKNVNTIYGLVTSRFINVDQLEFRERFIETARRKSPFLLQSLGISKTKCGEVVETFGFDSRGFQIQMNYGLVYAKNNGYDAYDVHWGRTVLICTNGLREWRGDNFKFQWNHTDAVEIDAFLDKTVQQGVKHLPHLERRIEMAMSTRLQRDTYGEFLQRLHIADASKRRVRERVEIESERVGRNEWALSQALTYLGTHEKSIDRRPRGLLTEAGTAILEGSLTAYVRDTPVYVDRDNFYRTMLPRDFHAA